MNTATEQQKVAAEQTVTLPETPVLTGPQAQGDLIILPWAETVGIGQRTREVDQASPVTKPVVVLTGDNGHDHTLAPVPGVSWFAAPTSSQTLGTLVVNKGSIGVLGHIEHGDTYIGPGVYVIRRQREQADEERLVAD